MTGADATRVARRRFNATVALLVCLALASGSSARAQDTVPPRPRFSAESDTNDAQAYLLLAVRSIRNDERAAGAAYYWASRIDPASAMAMYGRAISTIRAPSRNAFQKAELRRVDTLLLRASLLEPFLHRNLDPGIVPAITGGSRAVMLYLEASGPARLAWTAYSERRFVDAAGFYTLALDEIKAPALGILRALIHGRRGEAFWLGGEPDSAIAELGLALKEQQRREDKKLVRFYQPTAAYEYQLGWMLERTDHKPDAREAYGRALTEDLAFYPAHVRLAVLALEAGDTATALGEFDVAVQAGPNDAGLRYQYGWVLTAAHKLAEASQQLQQAVALEPWFAEPRILLAKLYEISDMADLAQLEYQAFLDRSAQLNEQRAFAQERLRVLKSGGAKP